MKWLQIFLRPSSFLYDILINIYLAHQSSSKYSHMIMLHKTFFLLFLLAHSLIVSAQQSNWIRPSNRTEPSVWGIKGGIVFSLWPYGVETGATPFGGGPRGLVRVGYEFNGKIYLINFLAIEPVVNGKLEFSEISPSQVDQYWGKLMWASPNENAKTFEPYSITPGIIDTITRNNTPVERLSIYVFMEKFANGAHPYLKLSICNDQPGELGIEIFEKEGSAKMERCVVTATMGNYARLRNIYLKQKQLNAKELYSNYNDVHFVEKESYPYSTFVKNKDGDFIVPAEGDENFTALASWPQEKAYLDRTSWRYRPPVKFTQYWKKESSKFDPSLQLRVNGRTFYWAGGTNDKTKYIHIPGGTAFENFELRENFYPGQKFYFGITQKAANELIK